MNAQHSKIFYYALSVYAAGAIAMLALPSGAELQTAMATGTSAKPAAKISDAAEITSHMTKLSVRNAASAQTADMTFAGNAAKF